MVCSAKRISMAAAQTSVLLTDALQLAMVLGLHCLARTDAASASSHILSSTRGVPSLMGSAITGVPRFLLLEPHADACGCSYLASSASRSPCHQSDGPGTPAACRPDTHKHRCHSGPALYTSYVSKQEARQPGCTRGLCFAVPEAQHLLNLVAVKAKIESGILSH